MERQKKQKTVETGTTPHVDVFTSVQLGLLLVYNSAVVKVRSLNLLFPKTWKEDWLHKRKGLVKPYNMVEAVVVICPFSLVLVCPNTFSLLFLFVYCM